MKRPGRTPAVAQALVFAAVTAVFWRTAYPTITWWDSSNYSLAATTLGLTSSPGSLLLTLLGWVTTRLPVPLPAAQTLNLLAGVLGAAASALVMLIAVRMHQLVSGSETGPDRAFVAGASLGALAFAFSLTLWEHAIKFTPYVLTAVFTALILYTLVRWWVDAERPGSWRWIMLLTFLFGLDFSVHRTNALLMPGALAWVLLRRPRTLVEARAWAGAISGMVAGLSFQLLVIPISVNTTSPLNMFQPDTWERFWDYVSLAQTGGNFQLDLWPRKSPFWSHQVADMVRVFAANFAHHKSSISVGGWLPVLAGVGGIFVMLRRSPRMAVAFLVLWLLQAATTVLYFNIPAEYFRSLDRHYLPVLTTYAVLVSLGAGAALRQVTSLWRRRPMLAAEGAAILLFLPLVQLVANWNANNGSRRFFTRDFAVNALEMLPPNAFYFTVGDNDTFPVMYMQAVEGVRPDVRIINLSLANTAWYIDQLRRRYPSFPVVGTPDERRAANARIWMDSTLVMRLPAPPERGLRAQSGALDSVVLRPQPDAGNQLLPADDVFLDVIRSAGFTTPVTVATTAGRSGLAWLQPNARLDGLHWRLVPERNPPPDVALLRENLERSEYRGYADSLVVLDDVTQVMANLYREAFKALLESTKAAGNLAECQAIATRLESILPGRRVAGAAAASMEGICRP